MVVLPEDVRISTREFYSWIENIFYRSVSRFLQRFREGAHLGRKAFRREWRNGSAFGGVQLNYPPPRGERPPSCRRVASMHHFQHSWRNLEVMFLFFYFLIIYGKKNQKLLLRTCGLINLMIASRKSALTFKIPILGTGMRFHNP